MILLRRFLSLILILSFSSLCFSQENNLSSDEKSIRQTVSDFFTYYQARNFDELSQLVDWNSPIIPDNIEGKEDLDTYLAVMSLHFPSHGETDYSKPTIEFIKFVNNLGTIMSSINKGENLKAVTIVCNMAHIKNEFESYSYIWIKADIKEVKMVSKEQALVILDILKYGINPVNDMFLAFEDLNFRVTLRKNNGSWQIYAFGSVLEDIHNHPLFLTFQGLQKSVDGKINEAIEDLKAAIAINPEFSLAHYILASVFVYHDLERLEQYPDALIEEAIKELKKAVELKSTVPLYHYKLGRLYKRLSEENKAQKEYKIVEQLDPNFPYVKNR